MDKRKKSLLFGGLAATMLFASGCAPKMGVLNNTSNQTSFSYNNQEVRIDRDTRRLLCIEDLNGYTFRDSQQYSIQLENCIKNRNYLVDKLGGRR